ncbi:MAG: DUF1648 domain-containing protein [Eubacterium sp.]|jgi:Protein of unknown function (DUF1648).|nr:DUF1648 domain-containing protein [Eubacterium sp.]
MKIRIGKADRILNILCLIIMVGMVLFLAAVWFEIPDKIPMHYGFDGTIDRWGAKSEIIIMPVVTGGMYIFLTFIERVPQIWNIGVEVTKENKERIYSLVLHLISTIKFIVICIFTYLSVKIAIGGGLPAWFLPVVLLVTFGDIFYWSLKLWKAK